MLSTRFSVAFPLTIKTNGPKWCMDNAHRIAWILAGLLCTNTSLLKWPGPTYPKANLSTPGHYPYSTTYSYLLPRQIAMFAEAKYVHSPDLGLWKGAVHFAFAVALSLSQPLVNIFPAADADTRYSHQSNFVKYTPTAVRQQSPQTTWDYVHFVYSKSSADINTNAPLSSGATQPSTIPTIVLALALCMILALASASLVLDKGVRTASGPRSDASGSSHRPRFASASPLARKVLTRCYRRARRTASFSSSSGSGSSSNTGNTSRRRPPVAEPQSQPHSRPLRRS